MCVSSTRTMSASCTAARNRSRFPPPRPGWSPRPASRGPRPLSAPHGLGFAFPSPPAPGGAREDVEDDEEREAAASASDRAADLRPPGHPWIHRNSFPMRFRRSAKCGSPLSKRADPMSAAAAETRSKRAIRSGAACVGRTHPEILRPGARGDWRRPPSESGAGTIDTG